MTDLATQILSERNTILVYIGQAGYVIKSRSGQLIGIDLYLSNCVERVERNIGYKRLIPKVLYPTDLEFDALIATHSHFDHFDIDAIPLMMENRRTKLYASVSCEVEIKRLNMTGENCTYIRPGDKADVGDFHIEFVDCDHGTSAPDAVGVIIEVDGKAVYMAGDTCLRMDRAHELKKKWLFNVVIGPINGAYGNMNANEFAEYVHALGGKISIPCHFGMFADHGGDPKKFLNIMKEKYPMNAVLLMTPGEKLIL